MGDAGTKTGESAEGYFRQALALAETLGLRPLSAHCHLGLGTLSGRAGRPQEARASLTAAATMFAEMDTRHWRAQAETALDTLSPGPGSE